MSLNVKEPFPVSNFLPTGKMNCYEYYLNNTAKFNDYPQFSVMGADHMRSRAINDIEALAVFFEKDLGLKRGDVFSIFMPTNIESLLVFYALNKLGVIVDFIHPLLPPEVVKENMLFVGSKGVAAVDATVRPYVEMINSLGLPCLLCSVFTYAPPEVTKMMLAKMGNVPPIGLTNATPYFEVLKKYSGHKVEGLCGNGDDTAVFMNGGGTTGKSKTIKISSKSLNEILYMQTYIDQSCGNGEEAEIITLPFFHAYGLCAAGIMSMCKGMKVIPVMKYDADTIIDLMKKNNVVGMSGTPSFFKKLYSSPNFDGAHLNSLRYLYVGGDDLSTPFLHGFNDILKKNGSQTLLCQGYGLTEACCVCTTNRAWDYKYGSIGKPLATTRIEIWDDDKNPLPNGKIGEIAITSTAMMSGYYTGENTEETGLYYDKNGTPWVLTGDVGYKDDDGFYFFSGRKKRVIIISGFNVYPLDVENIVDELSFIKEACAVQGYQNGKSIVRLYASLNENGDEEEYKRIITESCEKYLSKYAVPREIVFIEALPHTPLEKIDFMKLTEKKPE